MTVLKSIHQRESVVGYDVLPNMTSFGRVILIQLKRHSYNLVWFQEKEEKADRFILSWNVSLVPSGTNGYWEISL